MTENTTKYALVWDGADYEGTIIGTAEEVASEYLETKGFELKVNTNEDGDLGCWTKDADADDDEWDFEEYLDDQGSPEANLKEAREWYFGFYIADDLDGCGYWLYEIETPEQETALVGAFTADIEVLLDRITFKEARDNDLDPDYDEYAVRVWYYENKATKAA